MGSLFVVVVLFLFLLVVFSHLLFTHPTPNKTQHPKQTTKKGESLGSLYSPFFLTSLKLTAWFKAALLAHRPLDMAASTLRDIAKDMAGGTDAAVTVDERAGGDKKGGVAGAALRVTDCVFYDVLAREEALPQLLRFFCCQHNLGWLRAYEGQRVAASLEACKAKGDAECCIRVAEAAAKK